MSPSDPAGRSAPPTIRIAAGVVDSIVAHARADDPLECCGLLLGDSDEIRQAFAARNASSCPRSRYLVDPADHFRAIRLARVHGLTVVGAYHSHPAGPGVPSATDLAEADDEQWLHVIVRGPRAGDGPSLRAFRIGGGNFHETRLVPFA